VIGASSIPRPRVAVRPSIGRPGLACFPLGGVFREPELTARQIAPSVMGTARRLRPSSRELNGPTHGPSADWHTGRQSCGSRAVSHITQQGAVCLTLSWRVLDLIRRPAARFSPGLGPSASYPGGFMRTARERAIDPAAS